MTLLLAALGLRLYGLNWDRGNDLHPDELFIAKLVLVGRIHFEWPPDLAALLDPAISGLNPRSADPERRATATSPTAPCPSWSPTSSPRSSPA